MKMHPALAAGLVAVSLGVAAPLAKANDIVDTAASAGQFETLVAAVKAAGLVETLKGDGPFTVFAPTDEAFAKLPAGTVETLLKPENKDLLVTILTYHVIAGKISSGAIAGKQAFAMTIQGGSVYTSGVSSGGVYVSEEASVNSAEMAKVIKADIGTDNGVIHIIDRVLLPK